MLNGNPVRDRNPKVVSRDDRQCHQRYPHLIAIMSWVEVDRSFGVWELAPALQARQVAGGIEGDQRPEPLADRP
jgi:hypothetical protein